jgi:hypothetical protein
MLILFAIDLHNVSKCVWTTPICFVMYMENLQWKIKQGLTPRINKVYELYFGCKFGDEDKPWVPHFCRVTCASKRKWLQGSRPSVPFAVPTVWCEQKNHIRDCYYCLTNVKYSSAKSKHVAQYPNLPSALRTVPHEGFPIPKLPMDWTNDHEGEESFSYNGHRATTGIECQDPDFLR